MIIGSHVSFGNTQLLASAKEAISYNANTFMFYTGAPQNTVRKEINENYTNEALKLMKENNININFVKIDTIEKAKNTPCVFNNWANFYKGKFISNTILNTNSFEKLIK